MNSYCKSLKAKEFNDLVVLAVLECSCCIQILVIVQKEPMSQICVVPLFKLDNLITFRLLQIMCLFYI